MDTSIQTLTQSAIVQSLGEHQEHSVKRFTHDIHDNAPYRSFTRSTDRPYIGNDSPDSTLRFRVERKGYLNKMYLGVSIDASRSSDKDQAFGKEPGPEFFASFFTSASIYIGGKCIETLYPESILFKAFQLRNPVADTVMRGLRGFESATTHDNLDTNDLNFNITPFSGSSYRFQIPLDFSVMQFYKDSLDTNFVAPIEIEIKKRRMAVRQNGAANVTKCELICGYHNVHHHLRNQIRNTNFSKDTTTLLTTANYLLVDSGVQEQVAEVGEQLNPYVPGYSAFGRSTFKLDHLDLFASDILITFRKPNPTVLDAYWGDIVPSPSKVGFMKFILVANNRVIFEKFHYEMLRQHMNRSNLYIGDHCVESQSTKYIGDRDLTGNPHDMGDTIDLDITQQNDAAHSSRTTPTMYRIPLSLFSSDEFLCGGLNLKALSNARLIIEGEALLPEVIEQDYKGLVPQIVIRHKKLVRVDTKTGTFSV